MAVGAFMFHTPKSSASTNRRLVVASNQPVTKCEGIEQEHQHQHRQPQLLYQQRAITRRDTLSAIAVAIACGISTTRPSAAAPPMTAKEADGLSFRFERQFRRIPPAKLLRPMLNLDFAVLLMRSSYNAVDELNFVPMDQFQRDFFLIRQAEYLPYASSLGPGLVQQGDLTDAYYFDFISFAQYRTIYRDISVDPLTIFQEKQPVDVQSGGMEGENIRQDFVTKIVQRDPSIDNSVLAQLHDEYVGSKILDKLTATFQDTPSAIPPLDYQTSSSSQVLKSLQQLVNLFLVNGYAFDGKVELIEKNGIDLGGGGGGGGG
eukprot:CAMPEP_0176496304 /NCGR_PEP_ID=MMETSP0200_2-20121128/11122_1 /TAXON_ID=947934 /ORGANISM="Chaetoceros sp., Strain GSL56" /LENGTH=317 /DNA_ID=CAMNT_0017894247 /DNA_START=451 /DNA_END=1400 /DNA_ORIENTATION=-